MIRNQLNINLYHGATAFEDFRIDTSNLALIKSTDCGARGKSAGVTGTATAFALQMAQSLNSKKARSSNSTTIRFPFSVGEGTESTETFTQPML